MRNQTMTLRAIGQCAFNFVAFMQRKNTLFTAALQAEVNNAFVVRMCSAVIFFVAAVIQENENGSFNLWTLGLWVIAFATLIKLAKDYGKATGNKNDKV